MSVPSRVAMLIGCFASAACAPAPPAAPPESDVSVVRRDDGSQCEYRGRVDRQNVEARSPGARFPNVRRVYLLSGKGAHQRRTLLCREVDTNLDGTKDVFRHYDELGQPLRESADSNYDGKADTWLHFSGGRVITLEHDLDADGKADEKRQYSEGKLTRVQRDSNRDGKPDVWEVHGKRGIERMGFDVDFDGVVDRWAQGFPAETQGSQSKPEAD